MDVDSLILLNQSQAMVPLACDQDDGRRRGHVHKRTDSPWRTNEKVDGYKVDSGKVTWHPHGLSCPQETSKWNILRLTINPNQQNRYMERILKNACFYEDLPYKEKFPFPKKEESRFYTTIKTLKHSQTKVRIISPSSGTLELWKFSNLTFGGFLADITPVLS